MSTRYAPHAGEVGVGVQRTTVSVDLDNFAANLRAAQKLVSPTGVMPMLKCDAYGHGIAPIARTALGTGATVFGVAFVEEGVAVRKQLRTPTGATVLVCTEPAEGEEDQAVAADLTSTVYTSEGIDRLAAAARRLGRQAEVHLKVDTGLHRLGVAPWNAVELAHRIAGSGLRLRGMWTHFATADDQDQAFLRAQTKLFIDTVAQVERSGMPVPVRHTANSAATLTAEETRLDLVRLGALLYGVRPKATAAGADHFAPVLSWHSHVAMTRVCGRDERISYGHQYRLEKESVIAVAPVGFGDGLSRLLGNRGEVLIGGRRRRIAGAVGMSHIMVDCGTDQVAVGDPVVLLGRQGGAEISAEEMAQRSASTAYEVLTRISARVPRTYRSTVERSREGNGLTR
jgi:alanine racemase